MQIRSLVWQRLILLAVAAFAVAAPVDAQQVVVRPLRRDTTQRDSFTVRVLRSGAQDSIMIRIDSVFRRLDREPLGSSDRRELETTFQGLMKQMVTLVGTGGEFNIRVDGGAVVGNIRDMIGKALIEQGEGLRHLQRSMPKGWIGIYAEGPRIHRVIGDNELIHYFSYPAIVSVEPNSPAGRAGIMAGDTLVAYNGADIRDREINLSRLLVPDRRLAVTVRRDGDTREFPMMVAKAPESFIETRVALSGPIPDSLMGRIFLRGPGGEPVRVGGRMVGVASSEGPTRVERVLPSRAAPGTIFFRSNTDGNGSVWGAQLATIDEGLARTLGVKSGVLVTLVAPATPAHKSGLESGDIIVKVDGRQLTSVDGLRRATMEASNDHSVALQIQRAKKTKTITVKW